MAQTSISPRARALCAALREARTSRGISLRELGRLVSIHNAQLSLWENGQRVPNLETVATILGALRVAPEEREHILDLARQANEPHWLSVGVNGIPQQLAAVIECERAAHTITQWVPTGIPGLLQTPDYARAIKQAAGTADVELRVMVQAGRKEILTREKPVTYIAVIGEAIFKECIGSPWVMADQFKRLNATGDLSNITIQVMPQGVGWHPGWAGRFTLYEFPTAPPIVYFEQHSSGSFVSDAHDIAEYRKAIDTIRQFAKDPVESREIIESIQRHWEVKA